MIWTLLLAHFLGDYALQNSWMVVAKRSRPGLLLHVFVHLLTLLALTWGSWIEVLPYILVLTISHYLIDELKNIISKSRPDWQIRTYIFDQVLHLATIILIADWYSNSSPDTVLMFAGRWQQFGVAVLLATQVWFISERIIFYQEPGFMQIINSKYLSRLATRFLLFVGFVYLLTGNVQQHISSTSLALLPYKKSEFGFRTFATDLVISFLCALLLRLP